VIQKERIKGDTLEKARNDLELISTKAKAFGCGIFGACKYGRPEKVL